MAMVEIPDGLAARLADHSQATDLSPAQLVQMWCEWGLIMDETSRPDPEYSDEDLILTGCRLLYTHAELDATAIRLISDAQRETKHLPSWARRFIEAAKAARLHPPVTIPEVEMDLLRRALARAGELAGRARLAESVLRDQHQRGH